MSDIGSNQSQKLAMIPSFRLDYHRKKEQRNRRLMLAAVLLSLAFQILYPSLVDDSYINLAQEHLSVFLAVLLSGFATIMASAYLACSLHDFSKASVTSMANLGIAVKSSHTVRGLLKEIKSTTVTEKMVEELVAIAEKECASEYYNFWNTETPEETDKKDQSDDQH